MLGLLDSFSLGIHGFVRNSFKRWKTKQNKTKAKSHLNLKDLVSQNRLVFPSGRAGLGV